MKLVGLKLVFFYRYKRFIKFGLVGLSNTMIALAVYYLLVAVGTYYQVANVAAFIISSLSGFFLNRGWVFKANRDSFHLQLLKYYTVYCSSLLVSMALLYVWVEALHVNKYFAPLLNLCVTIPYNYLFNKTWAFRVK
jgi:putative flippase GtrA